jgi:membrane protease subunit (stomatin/prohibitin family)
MANSIKTEEKLERFRLVAEMDSNQVYSVHLTEEQQDLLHKALEKILVGKLDIHAAPYRRYR